MSPVGRPTARPLAVSSAKPPAAAPPSKAGSLRVADLLERLAVPAGRTLGDALFAKVAPHFAEERMLEPAMAFKNPPRTQLTRALAEVFQMQFTAAFSARDELPAALENLFVEKLKPDGTLDLDKIRAVAGPELIEWLESMAAVSLEGPKHQLHDRFAFDQMARGAAERVFRAAPSIAPDMPALEMVSKQFGRPDAFKGFQLMGLQHLFASTASLFKELEAMGLDASKSQVVGKIYSTNFRVAGELESRGYEVAAASKFLMSGDFAGRMEESIRNGLGDLVATLPTPSGYLNGEPHWDPPPTPRVLLMDDGAEAIRMLHEEFAEYAPFFVCVEQTRRGARIVHQLEADGQLKCPVVNVAESWAKLVTESPMIGESVVKEVMRKLDRLERQGLSLPKKATVVGYGAVGQQVAAALVARGVTVHIFDKDPSRLTSLPKGMVGHTDKLEALSHGELLVSCVGARTLGPGDHEALPDGAILVNAASANDELGQEFLPPSLEVETVIDKNGETWGLFRGKPINLGVLEAQAHSDSVQTLPSGKELLLVSNGYVVNMTGERDSIPPRFIQLTRGLLLMGALQARDAKTPGLISLPEAWQQALVKHVEQQLEPGGESLRRPLWDAVTDVTPSAPPPGIIALARERAGRPRTVDAPLTDTPLTDTPKLPSFANRPSAPLQPIAPNIVLKPGGRSSHDLIITKTFDGLTPEEAAARVLKAYQGTIHPRQLGFVKQVIDERIVDLQTVLNNVFTPGTPNRGFLEKLQPAEVSVLSSLTFSQPIIYEVKKAGEKPRYFMRSPRTHDFIEMQETPVQVVMRARVTFDAHPKIGVDYLPWNNAALQRAPL